MDFLSPVSFICAASLLAAMHCSAALISLDSSFGADTITRDTDTNREWLDLRLSSGFSFNAIAAQLGAGGTFEGFAFASSGEVNTLLTNAGLYAGAPGPAAFDAFQDTGGLLGALFIEDISGDGCVLSLFGIVSNVGSPSTHQVGGVVNERFLDGFICNDSTSFNTPNNAGGFEWADTDSIDASDVVRLAGAWLVRDAAVVNVPAPPALLALGIGLLARARRHR